MTSKPRRSRAGRTVRQTAQDWKPVGDRLRALRERAGLSRSAAEALTGVDRQTLVRYESGSRAPSVLALIALARSYDVTTDWLLLGRRAG